MNAVTIQSDPRRSVAVAPRPVLVPQTFDQLVRFAEMAAGSDLMPRDYKGKPANIMIAVQMGSELGLQPMQSLNSIAVINGRPGVWGDGMIGLCRQSHLCEDIIEKIEGEGEHRTATCIAKRRGSSSCTSTFSMADAKRAGLLGKQGPWTQYPDRMLQNRARGFALRDAFPDLLRGLKTVEELRDYPDAQHQAEPPVALQAHQSAPIRATRQPDTTDADAIPDFDAPPVKDKLAEAAGRIRSKLDAATDEDSYNVVMQNQGIIMYWDKIVAERPELAAELEAHRQTVLDRIADVGAAGEP